jgi:hypothetical protein
MTRRLALLDLAFFVLETAERPMNVGPLIVLKPPPSRRGLARSRIGSTTGCCADPWARRSISSSNPRR